MYNYELTDNTLKTWILLRQASEATEKVLERDIDRQGASLVQVDVLSILDACKVTPTPGHALHQS